MWITTLHTLFYESYMNVKLTLLQVKENAKTFVAEELHGTSQ